MIAGSAPPGQAPLVDLPSLALNVAIASLALGGAERIVTDWAARSARAHRVRLIVLRGAAPARPAPEGVEIIRLRTDDPRLRLREAGARLAAGGNPVVLCHLLTRAERDALAAGGAQPVPVLHNAQAGWPEPAVALERDARVITVSRAAAAQLAACGHRGERIVVYHLPCAPAGLPQARSCWRERWAIPPDAMVIGMIGGVKPQKAYPRALRIFAALLERRDAFLVILGGPVGREGALAWQATLAQALRLGLESRVRLPGFCSTRRNACRLSTCCSIPAVTKACRWRRWKRSRRACRWSRAAWAGRTRSKRRASSSFPSRRRARTGRARSKRVSASARRARLAALSRAPRLDPVPHRGAFRASARGAVRHGEPQRGRRAALARQPCARPGRKDPARGRGGGQFDRGGFSA